MSVKIYCIVNAVVVFRTVGDGDESTECAVINDEITNGAGTIFRPSEVLFPFGLI
jgi:hypothetical protein